MLNFQGSQYIFRVRSLRLLLIFYMELLKFKLNYQYRLYHKYRLFMVQTVFYYSSNGENKQQKNPCTAVGFRLLYRYTGSVFAQGGIYG
jgi:hypothetical protein